MFTVICDNCGEDSARDEEYSCWDNESYTIDNAIEKGWIEENGKHYCSDCVDYDDEDNLILNPNRTKEIKDNGKTKKMVL